MTDRRREKSLFDELLGLDDPARRADLLERVGADDPALRRRLERLLAAQAPAERFFTLAPARPAAAAPDSLLPGQPARIDRYRLVRRLGEGGCGVVYLAEQEEPVRRQVALKIIRLGMDTERVIARFELERQALALMDHPHIARVLDAGATDTGRPYFVMERVEGVKITDYCDRRRLSLERRIALFVSACQAIQHAHQKGILHRDIKPSNILVAELDGQPVAKVIDFGVAKAIDGRLGEDTLLAPDPQIVGTPAYMSPEQADLRLGGVDTRGDIYSLGVVLHELLVGRPPFDSDRLLAAGVEEMRRVLREQEPARPSVHLASLAPDELRRVAELRAADPRRLLAAVRGDLDWIVTRCLEKDRARRYETANGLAMDLRRHLQNEPVSARPPSRRYRLQKLARRNRVTFGAGLLVLLALVFGLGASTWMFVREREARREQTRLRDEAERARAAEVSLRLQAEAREKVTQAAVLLNRSQFEAAEALVAPLQRGWLRPSLEAVDVFGALGGWHALHRRWPLAAERYWFFASSILAVDDADTDDISRHLMPAASAILEAGADADYERFRGAVVARFAHTAKPIPAEQVVKVCLLAPADPATLRELAPLAAIVVASLGRADPALSADPYMDAWRCFALSLHEHRRGDAARALVWADLSVRYQNTNTPRYLSVRLLRAMALGRLGQEAAAHDELEKCRRLLDEAFPEPLSAGSPEQGFWFDWINARILLREAIVEIGD